MLYVQLYAETLHKTVDMGVIVPENYDKILIMLHGHNGTIGEVDRLFPLQKYAADWNMLIAVPELGNDFYVDKNAEGENAFIVSDFLSGELPGYIRETYHLPKEAAVYLGGYSMGGFGTMLNGLKKPECFKGLISVHGAFLANEFAKGSGFVAGSPLMVQEGRRIFEIKEDEYFAEVLWDTPEAPKWNPNEAVKQMPQDVIDKLPPIVLTCATLDVWYGSTLDFKKELEKRKIPVGYYEIVDGAHDFPEFDEGFQYAFRVLFGVEGRD